MHPQEPAVIFESRDPKRADPMRCANRKQKGDVKHAVNERNEDDEEGKARPLSQRHESRTSTPPARARTHASGVGDPCLPRSIYTHVRAARVSVAPRSSVCRSGCLRRGREGLVRLTDEWTDVDGRAHHPIATQLTKMMKTVMRCSSPPCLHTSHACSCIASRLP